MLDLFGSGYVIDHCISAFSEKQKWELYRIYVTDALKAKFNLNFRYKEYFDKPETRTAEEIKDGIKNKLKMLGGGE